MPGLDGEKGDRGYPGQQGAKGEAGDVSEKGQKGEAGPPGLYIKQKILNYIQLYSNLFFFSKVFEELMEDQEMMAIQVQKVTPVCQGELKRT